MAAHLEQQRELDGALRPSPFALFNQPSATFGGVNAVDAPSSALALLQTHPGAEQRVSSDGVKDLVPAVAPAVVAPVDPVRPTVVTGASSCLFFSLGFPLNP
jgi:hypothetical protein